MKAVLCIIFLTFTHIVNASTYSLLPVSSDNVVAIDSGLVKADDGLIALEDMEVVEVVEEDKYKEIKALYDAYVYLLGTAGLTITGFLARLGYLLYKTKTGQLFVKHIKNNASDLENDIVQNIIKITDLETGEDLRRRLKSVQSKLLEIARSKLPPKP